MSNFSIPSTAPVCPVRGSVIYPGMVQNIDASREVSIGAIHAAQAADKVIVIVSQRDKDVDDPAPADLYTVGTVCSVLRVRQNSDGSVQMLVSAMERVRVSVERAGAHLRADLVALPTVTDITPPRLRALARELRERFGELGRGSRLSNDTLQTVLGKEDPSELADYVAFHVDLTLEQRQAVLETPELGVRLEKVLGMLQGESEVQQLQQRIRDQVREEVDKNQREYFLREQMKVIQKELGGGEEAESEDDEFRAKIEALGLPEGVKKEVDRELSRLTRMHPDAAEASVIRTYLNWITELPWSNRSDDRLDIAAAAAVLEEDHYGLEKVKDRVLEYLAVRSLRKLRADRGEIEAGAVNKGPILVFTGPPGVGKTSIAQSIARALGREYVRIALGGMRDESDIRGHRRTYIGAMPGRLVQGLRTAGTKNPVMLLDEIDKLGTSHQGDPSSALLEVLDPAQNAFFTDHYLGVPFDLSEVMFIATANYPEQIPAPLMDRMEVIEFTSYIEQEKLEIAKRYLLPRQLDHNGLKAAQLHMSDAAIERLISHYTREAGVRQLEREFGAVARKVARRIAGGEIKRARVTDKELERYLGQPRHIPEHEAGEDMVGVSTGMFYTPVGGDILFVETSVMPGKGLVLTGQLGEVMKESARAALSYAKKNAERFRLSTDRIENSEVHMHVPAGAIPKEGPSAGVTMATSLISALSGVPTRRDVAMTGEITLTGRVLPIGGLKEKVLGARRAGIKHVILPKANEADLADIPLHLRASLRFHPCETLDEVLNVALVGGLGALEGEAVPVSAPRRRAAPRRDARPAPKVQS